METNNEIFFRDTELKEFQKEITDLIQREREKEEHAHFKREIDVNELTAADMGMYRHIQELELKGFDIDTFAKLKKEMAFISRYRDAVRVSQNNSRDIFMQWVVNKAQEMSLRIESALERLPTFKKEMEHIVRDELRKKRMKKEYDKSFDDPIDIGKLLPADMLIYEWAHALNTLSPEETETITQKDFEQYRAHYFKYFNQVPKNNKSRRTFVHYVGNLVTATLSELELRVMYPEDFQKISS